MSNMNKIIINISFFLVSFWQNIQPNMLMDMAVMMGAQTGASIADQMASSSLDIMNQTIQHAQHDLQTSMGLFAKQLEAAQQEEAKAVFKLFQNAQKYIDHQQSDQGEIIKQLKEYIFKAISINQPQQHYLFSSPKFDEMFTLGTMYTPKGPIWKNPFPMGDWIYDEHHNSFWQMGLMPTYTDTKKGNQTIKTSDKAQNNSIFAEYFTSRSSYAIVGEFTVYKASYPFFVGIMFNKARWISGDMDNLRKSRLVGVYGASKDSITVHYAEQYTMSDAQYKAAQKKVTKGTQITPTQYPLPQILSNNTKPKQTISSDLFSDLRQKPVTLLFEIITSPTKVKFRLWPKGSKKPSQFIEINNTQSDLYLYHGIGCISPGAITEFKFAAPQDFVFQKKNIDLYKKELTQNKGTDHDTK